MKKSKEYIYSINDFKMVKKERDLIFKAMDFYAISNIVFTNNTKLSNRIGDLAIILKQHCVKEEI